MRIQGCEQSVIANTGFPTQKVGILFKVRIEGIEVLRIERFYQRLRLLSDAKYLSDMTHSVHHMLGFFGALWCISLRVQKVILHKMEVFCWKIPTVVHRRPQQPIVTNHVEQRADNLLARPRWLAGAAIGRLKMLNDRSAVPNDLSCRSDQRRYRRELGLGQYLSLKTFMARRPFLKRNTLLNKVSASPT